MYVCQIYCKFWKDKFLYLEVSSAKTQNLIPSIFSTATKHLVQWLLSKAQRILRPFYLASTHRDEQISSFLRKLIYKLGDFHLT